MSRFQKVVFLLLFCFGSYLNVNLSCTSNLVAQEYVPQEYLPIYGQSYEYPQSSEYPNLDSFQESYYPLQPQYQPPLYDDLPQNDYRIVPGVLLSEKVVPQVDQEAFDKATEDLKLLEKT